MKLAAQLAKQSQEVLLNGHWISTNFKEQLSDVTWEQAQKKIGSLNSIAALTYHIHYYVQGLVHVLEGGTLDIKDKYSFDIPLIQSEEEWQQFLQMTWDTANRYCDLIATMSDDKVVSAFIEEKYGNYYRNLIGTIEHSYYHLGQVVIIKKLLKEGYGK